MNKAENTLMVKKFRVSDFLLKIAIYISALIAVLILV